MQWVIAQDIFSGNVLVAQDGKIIYKKSFGYADWEKNSALNDTTMFNIGSNGKDFTQTLICQLIQEGTLRLNDPISAYLTGFPKKVGDQITIKQLLTMRSGMGDYMRSPKFEFGKYRTISDLVAFIQNEPLFFEPGSDRLYSNSGYVVLGGIIEKITGKTYAENVLERILKPLGLTHSMFIFPDTKTTYAKASGTEITLSGQKRNERRFQSTPTSAGGMYATTTDLMAFYEARMYKNTLLNDDLKLSLFSNYDPKPKSVWKDKLADENFSTALAGGLNGWNSIVIQIPYKRITIIVLSNYDDLGQPAEQVGRCITRIVQGKSYDPPTAAFPQFSYQYISKVSIQDFIDNFDRILKENNYEFRGPMMLNQFGYNLIRENKLEWAVEIFKLNANRFPSDPNVYDSLGEAYSLTGNKTAAIENYSKALELTPDERDKRRISTILQSLKGGQ